MDNNYIIKFDEDRFCENSEEIMELYMQLNKSIFDTFRQVEKLESYTFSNLLAEQKLDLSDETMEKVNAVANAAQALKETAEYIREQISIIEDQKKETRPSFDSLLKKAKQKENNQAASINNSNDFIKDWQAVK